MSTISQSKGKQVLLAYHCTIMKVSHLHWLTHSVNYEEPENTSQSSDLNHCVLIQSIMQQHFIKASRVDHKSQEKRIVEGRDNMLQIFKEEE